MNKKTISIIVPVYNVERFVARCIESVMIQIYSDWELLLIDDGSIDSSGSICDYYAEKESRIKVIHTPNNGRSNARNMGISKASGEWVTFIDSDDFVSPFYLQSMVDANPDFNSQILVSQGYKAVYEDGALCKDYPESCYENWIVEVYKDTSIIQTHNLLHIQSVWGRLYNLHKIRLNQITFHTRISHSEDGVFLHKYMLLCDTLVFVSHQGYFYTAPIINNKNYKINYEETYYLAYQYEKLVPKLIMYFNISDRLYMQRIIDMYQARLGILLWDPQCPIKWKQKAKSLSRSYIFRRPILNINDFKLFLKYNFR